MNNNKTISPDNITFLYENVESLSFRIVDYGNVVFLPILVVFSIITNTLTLIVLTQPILKKKIFTYMFAMCLFDCYSLISTFWLCLIRCGALCPHEFSYSYGSKFYELYFYLFLDNVTEFLSNVMDVHIAFNRLFSFSTSNKFSFKFNKIPFKFQCLLWIIFSLIIALPSFILTKSVRIIGYLVTKSYSFNNTEFNTSYEPLYQIQSNRLQNMNAAKLILVLISQVIYIAKPILLIILCIVNFVMGVKFKKYLQEKRKIAPFSKF